MVDVTTLRAGDRVGSVRRRGRRLETYALQIGGGLCLNVVDGRMVNVGLEPVGPVVTGSTHRRRHLRVVWAAPLGAAAAGAAAVATGIVLRHRRAA
jgi:hypothetical protein